MSVDDLRLMLDTLTPGPSMLEELPKQWTVSAGFNGEFWLLGGPPMDPDVVVAVAQAASASGDRDLTESLAWLLGESLADLIGGRVLPGDLTEDELAGVSSPARMLFRAGGGRA